MIGRRSVLKLGGAALALLRPLPVAALSPLPAKRHGFSPLGELKYGPDFTAFDYVAADAPKGGALRLARTGAFDSIDTLHYPGLPPADIRLIYDHLAVPSDDEVASYYGLLADNILVSDDFTSIVMDLDGAAQWHDGRPVIAADVVFTFRTLQAEGAPFYRQAFRELTITSLHERRVVFENPRPGDRDMLRRIATVPIHPAHVQPDAGGTGGTRLPLGSGPYRVAEVEAPRRLVLERVTDYWGRERPVNAGRWNFDRLSFDYFRDQTVALEAFKADAYDIRSEENAVRWRSGYEGPALASGAIVRSATPSLSAGTLHGLVFNLRRPLLADRRVRLALCLAYDFQAVNRTLFGGAYLPFTSAFGETALAATGPAGEDERAIFAAAGTAPPGDGLQSPDPLAAYPVPGSREALAAASALLDEAGLALVGPDRIDPATGAPVRLSIVTPDPLYDRPLAWLERAARRLGLALQRVPTDSAAAARRMLDRDFDLAGLSWSPARLPGTAERLLWHSALARSPHSYALSGIESRALDAAIEALEHARTEAALVAAGRAFDRAFRQLVVLLPMWRSDEIWLAWWDRFARPAAEQQGFPPSPLDRWWARQ